MSVIYEIFHHDILIPCFLALEDFLPHRTHMLVGGIYVYIFLHINKNSIFFMFLTEFMMKKVLDFTVNSR